MIEKYSDQPIWFRILVPVVLSILIANTAGYIIIRASLASGTDRIRDIGSIMQSVFILQFGIFILTAAVTAVTAIKSTSGLTKFVIQKYRKVSLLEPAIGNETRLMTGILDEYTKIFTEKNNNLIEAQNKLENCRRLMDELPFPIVRINNDGIFSYMNNAAMGAELEKIFDRNSRLLAPWRQNLNTLTAERKSVEWITEISRYLVQPVGIPKSREIILSFKDVTNSRELMDKINNYDLLTNLPNRVLFMEILSRAVKSADRTGENCICILIDIDDLERINDTMGYHGGDKLLRQFAGRLVATIRDEDTAARLSGDEFIILIPRLSRETLSLDFLQRIQQDLTKPFRLEEEEVSIKISMGISIYPDDGTGPEDLLKKANTALIRTKKLRRGTYTIFDPAHDNQTLKRRKMEKELEQAMSNREFELYYQPKVETGTEIVTGFEALIRWNREEPISPAEFIPLAEETGKIVEIGKFVIQEASRFLTRLSDRGRDDLQVAINISARQFKDPGFETYLLNTARAHSLDFSKLELEVTEGVAATETSEALTGLANLSAKGFSIAIDDFGTGYSSMNYLQDLSFDTLKIDKSFVDRITSESGLPIVKAIIALGKSIQKKIVAEGVETREQLDVLEGEGCDQIQGYYYSKPVPAEEALRLLDEWPAHRKKEF